MNIIEEIEKSQIKNRPQIKPGDVVAVHQEVEEGNKKRIQIFKGTVIQVSGSGARKSITVRKISLGVGIERVFPIHLPTITKITVLKSSHVRRAKLYYLRGRKGKGLRLKEKTVAADVIQLQEKLEKEEKVKVDRDLENKKADGANENKKADQANTGEQAEKTEKLAKAEKIKEKQPSQDSKNKS